MPSSALVVLIPEAEGLVAPSRMRHDPAAALGVPAHVTVLYPFMSPLDEGTGHRVAQIAQRQPRFTARFATVGRFPGDASDANERPHWVVWLRPEPPEPFAALIAAAMGSFPDWPPYAGTIAEPIAHLTVADGVDDERASLLEAEMQRGLPIHSEVDGLALIVEGDDGRWALERTWPLGAGAG